MKLLDRIENALVYRLDWYDGQIYIDVIGYHYNAGEPSIEGKDKTWRYNMFRGYEMPLSEFLASTEEDRAGWEEEYTRWIHDLTEQEVIEYFTGDDAPIGMWISEDITQKDASTSYEFIDAIY
jgi:hypothetical protein